MTPPGDPSCCATCAAPLTARPLDDPNLRGYGCANGHGFYSIVDEQAGGIPTADTIEPPSLSDDGAILRYWLTDPRARKRVPNMLAVVLRRILEISEHGRRIATVSAPFLFCPGCGERFHPFDSRDTHTLGRECRNGHQYYEHGYTLYYEKGRKNLSAELYDEFLAAQIRYYLTEPLVKPYVHPQIRAVLLRHEHVGK